MTRPTLAEFRALMDEYGFACAWSPLTQERTQQLHAKLFPPVLPRQGLFHADADALVKLAQADDTPEPHMEQVCDYHGHVTMRVPCPCRDGLCAGVTSDYLGPGGTRCRAHCQE